MMADAMKPVMMEIAARSRLLSPDPIEAQRGVAWSAAKRKATWPAIPHRAVELAASSWIEPALAGTRCRSMARLAHHCKSRIDRQQMLFRQRLRYFIQRYCHGLGERADRGAMD